MKRVLLLLPLLIATPLSAKIDSAIHKLCLEARDYEGCVRSNRRKSPVSEYIGIGLKLYVDQDSAKLIIALVVPDSPADSSGLKPGDFIYKIDGYKTNGMGIVKAAKLIKGKEGTYVKLGVIRGNGKKMEFKLKRSIIRIKSGMFLDEIPRFFFENFREKNTFPGINKGLTDI